MARTVAIGKQDFKNVIENNYFYVDKTDMIRQWWEAGDDVTLITRPRRFGKTLNMSMLNYFFSKQHKKDGHIFERLSIWESERYRELQGEYPVIFLSFAGIKETNFENVYDQFCEVLYSLYDDFRKVIVHSELTEAEKEDFQKICATLRDKTRSVVVENSLHSLSKFLYKVYGKKVIVLLDEYDTPMQEAYIYGFWEEIVSFFRTMFNATFKTNPFLERAIMTGITRVSKESIFSDLNNPKIVTTTSNKYATCFGFTEEEVFAAMDEFGYTEKDEVKKWYDGFVFGKTTDIYNPWSILNFLDNGRLAPYWSNTSGNGLVNKLLKEGNPSIKIQFERLLFGEKLHKIIDEEIVLHQLDDNENAIWSLLVASGYLKMENVVFYGDPECDLCITNFETKLMFEKLVRGWFGSQTYKYNTFIQALMLDDVDHMNEYMNDIALHCFSSFDVGKKSTDKKEPERFYHGFVLGMMVDLKDKYEITSNRESGLGRYDVMMIPRDVNSELPGIIMEFKVRQTYREASLGETVKVALKQIEDKKYEAVLKDRGIPAERIFKYGFAFEGKTVLIGDREKQLE